MTTELLPYQTLGALVSAHDAVVAKAESGLKLLAEAHELHRATVGEYASLWDGQGLSRLYLEDGATRTIEDMRQSVQERFWSYTMDQTGLRMKMGKGARDRMDRMFRDHTTPPFTRENLLATLQGLAESVGDLVAEAVCESFNFLRPRHYWRGEYKTNRKDRVGEKVIVENAMCSAWSWGLSRQDELNDVDKAFHALDGKGFPATGWGPMVTTLKEASGHGEFSAETDYFDLRWFKKGTLHIRFKRLDLLKEFNRIGSAGRNEVGEGR